MCGIVGTILPRTAERLAHRGPNKQGAHGFVAVPWAAVSVEMTRLSIVDRSDLPVPFHFDYCGVVLAFNGEIYNHRALREELSDGFPWQTDCDAEVVARAWRAWGPTMLQHFNGMWSLCLVDTRLGEVFLARDRAGEKPLYYATVGAGFAFASEIKALPITLEETNCPDFDVFEFDCLETTPFKGVSRLGPGQYIYLRHPSDLRAPEPTTWWLLGHEVDEGMTWQHAVDRTEALLVDAIRLRVPEVPFGVQLSGGLDSAIIQAVVRADRTYTVTFPADGVDNMPLAQQAARGVEPIAITFDLAALQEALPEIAYHLDTPATWTAVCQWFMCRRMAADGCVVALCGEGADELFGGYARYRALWAITQADADPRLAAYGAIRDRLFGRPSEAIARLLNRAPAQPAACERALELVGRFTSNQGASVGLVEDAMRVDFHTTMRVLLRMADCMSAAASMENRAVFFDHRIMDLATQMPLRWKINNSESKAVLCAVARRLGVPEAVVGQTTKKGLFIPWQKWSGALGWDRSGFASMMLAAWRGAFHL